MRIDNGANFATSGDYRSSSASQGSEGLLPSRQKMQATWEAVGKTSGPQEPSSAPAKNEDKGSEKGGKSKTAALPGQQATDPKTLAVITELRQTDQKVRAHEAAHVSAGGAYVTSGASFTYKTGPDGKRYAVGGEVQIDSSPIPDDPEATIAKMETVRKAALAPAQPSSQDLSVAASAAQREQEARSDARSKKSEEAGKKNQAKPSFNVIA